MTTRTSTPVSATNSVMSIERVERRADLPAFASVLSIEGGPIKLSADVRTQIAVLDLTPSDVAIAWINRREALGAYNLVVAQVQQQQRRIVGTYEVPGDLVRILHDFGQRQATAIKDAEGAETTVVQRKWKEILTASVVRRASDIHFLGREGHTDVKFRIDGRLVPYCQLTPPEYQAISNVIFNSAGTGRQQVFKASSYQSAEIDTAVSVEGVLIPVSLRYEGQPKGWENHNIILRVQAQRSDSEQSFAALGYTDGQIGALELMCGAGDGLIIVSGPMNSGKTTLIGACIRYTLKRGDGEIKVDTIEDPIEVKHTDTEQHPVTRNEAGEATGFEPAFRSMLRGDSNVIVIGEIRDGLTADCVRDATETGHLIFTTLHAKDSWVTITRLKKLGIDAAKLGEPGFLRGILNQRLLPVLCPHCRESARTTTDTDRRTSAERLHEYAQRPLDELFVRGSARRACRHCDGRGYAGRALAAEVFVPDDKFLHLVAAERWTEARDYWSLGHNTIFPELGGKLAIDHAIEHCFAGRVCPFDVETSFERFDWRTKRDSADSQAVRTIVTERPA